MWVCVWPYQPEAGKCFAGEPPGGNVVPGLFPPIPPAVPFPPPLIGITGGSTYGTGGNSYGTSTGYNDDDKVDIQGKSVDVVHSEQKLNPRTVPRTTTPKPPSSAYGLFQSVGGDRPKCLTVVRQLLFYYHIFRNSNPGGLYFRSKLSFPRLIKTDVISCTPPFEKVLV